MGRMRKPVIFITGAGGEIGHGLIDAPRRAPAGPSSRSIWRRSTPSLPGIVQREFLGSILDAGLLERILAEFEVDLVFHLAALLSTRSEFTPMRAHEVNVEGTLTLLEFAQKEAESHGRVRSSSSTRRRLPRTACPISRPRTARRHGDAKTTSTTRRRCTARTSCIASCWDATTRGTTSSWPRRR